MKLTKTLLASTALTVSAGAVAAQDMADSMTLVSWGGALVVADSVRLRWDPIQCFLIYSAETVFEV